MSTRVRGRFIVSPLSQPSATASQQLIAASTVEFVLTLGRALHRYGAPAHRLEEGLLDVCRRLGVQAEVFSTPTAIIMSFGDPGELRTRMMRVEGGELDMSKLARVDALADAVASRQMSPADGVRELAAILASRRAFGHGLSTLAHGMTAGSVAVFIGGALADVAIAALIGLSVGLLAQYARRSTDQARVFELVGSAFASFAAGIASAMWYATSYSIVIVAALLILLPGLSLTVAMTELATRNLIAGTARLMSAVIVLLQLAVGVALGEKAASALVQVHSAIPVALPEWARWVALAASAVGVSIIAQAQPRSFGWIAAACTVGYVGSRAGTTWLGGPSGTQMSGPLGVLVGAFALGVLSNIYARRFKRPAEVVSVPAVLLLVPGSTGFQSMASLLDRDTLSGVDGVFATFIAAIGIVAGLLIANAVVSPRRRV